jgi:hypothetical protein
VERSATLLPLGVEEGTSSSSSSSSSSSWNVAAEILCGAGDAGGNFANGCRQTHKQAGTQAGRHTGYCHTTQKYHWAYSSVTIDRIHGTADNPADGVVLIKKPE